MLDIPILTLKLLIVSYITAKRQLIHDRTAKRDTWNQSYDFIIVGAGGSGCVVANRLSEDPNISVLLLEKGGAQDAIYTDIPGMSPLISSERPQIGVIYYSEPQNNLHLINGNRLTVSMGNVIGGGTTHNQMAYYRSQRRDLDTWANCYGAKGWSFEEVLPFYLKFENNTDINIVRNNPDYHGTNGPVQISTPRIVPRIYQILQRVYNNLGYFNTDVNGVNQTGTMISQSYIDQNGFRSEAGNAYVDPNPHPNNLHIITKARVVKILFNGFIAVGVEFVRNDTTFRVYAQKEVISSAGALQTPQLLMLSGIGVRSHLETLGIPVLLDLPVGNNYQNLARIAFQSNTSQELVNPPRELSNNNLFEFYFNKSGPLSEISFLFLYFSTKTNSDKEWPNIIMSTSISKGQIRNAVFIGRLRSRGTVRLQSTSPYEPPKLDSKLYSCASDLDTAIEAVKFLLFVIERTSLEEYVRPNSFESVGCPSCPDRFMYECTEGIRCYILSVTEAVEHPSGTCRMGDIERDDVVVDPTLRVKNAPNLRICDTSIIPMLPTSGTTSDALMIGEKCSQLIKDSYGLL